MDIGRSARCTGRAVLFKQRRTHYDETEMIVLCFGNRAIPEDATAVELGESLDLPGVTFIPSSSPEEMVDYLEEDLYVMDVAQGIAEVTLITEPERFLPPPHVSAHDLDPAVFLKLVQQLYGVSVPVIALPMGIDRQIIREQLLRLLTALPDRMRPRRNGASPT
jgi:Ni,Fe-hydrogenase maturation factor